MSGVPIIPEGEHHIATVQVLPLDEKAFREAPRLFSQYATTQATIEDVSIVFSVKHLVDVGGTRQEVAYPQAFVFMSVPHFMRFASVIQTQAQKLLDKLEEINEEADSNVSHTDTR